MRDRENMRFERTRVFGRVRRIFVALGREFAALGVLEAAEDIFFLQIDEVFGFADGTAVSTDLKGLVKLRRAEYAAYREAPAPAAPDPDPGHRLRWIAVFGRRRGPSRPQATSGRGSGAAPASSKEPFEWRWIPGGRSCVRVKSSSPSGPIPGGSSCSPWPPA